MKLLARVLMNFKLKKLSDQVIVITGASAGIPFGAAFWLLADEISVPLLGFSKGPTEYPVSTHAYALASHLIYGATAELSRRVIRHVL